MKNYLSLVKFSHTIFALPFAIIGFFLATIQIQTPIEWIKLIYVVLCMVFARSAAMAFNRYIDRDIDKANERTAAVREIPNGTIQPKSALLFVIINCILFIATTYFINPLCFYLSPIALLVVLGYSLTKRFTALCHLVLGVGLSLAPIGAYLAVTGKFDWLPLFFSFAVLFWVSGFDIIYALQDEEFDKKQKLHSIPVLLGTKNALMLSNFLHVLTASFILFAGYYGGLNYIYWIGCGIFILLLIYQHILVKPNDLSKVNLAFFTTNGIASVVFSIFVLLDLFLN
ncbi:4-hydroxybenzoate octaprenyltransferase [Vicingus serpentipes]|uniref:4-hydroxybenzoate polyprenyltransferase n=1 Tax=Vicingus serpentipes TaxID=1926625 RepID=A0A5C6RSU3_9FLAO|nr:UbiA-like polyprenyltransferase [Vicingus serpentipes]TXB65338.1 4-hydroxybenzoate octaprenyltransferase [Vicingus serpentipes]